MLRKISVALVVASVQIIWGLYPASAAQTLTLIAEESFDYSGNIVGKSGGSGFTSNWAAHYGASNFSIQSPGLTYAGLTTSGGYMYACSATPNTVCGVSRDIPTQNSGAIYIQFLAEFTSQTGGGTPNIRLFDGSDNLSGGIGANGNPTISIFDSGFNTSAQASAGTLNSLSFVIVKIDYQNTKTSMWVNPNLATFSYFNPPTPDAQFDNLAAQVKTLAFYARAGVKYDELKVYKLSGTTAAEDEAAAAAEKKRSDEARAAKIRLARAELVTRLESNSEITGLLLQEADSPIKNPANLLLAYQELLEFRKTLSSPLSSEARNQKINFTIRKHSLIEKISTASTQKLFARDLVNYQIIPDSTPQKTRIIDKIFKMPFSARDTVEKFNNLVAREVQISQNRDARLEARLKKTN